MHIISPCVRPKQANKEEIHIFAKDFEGQGRHDDSKTGPDPVGRTAFWGQIGVTWGSVGDFGSFWSLEDHFEIIVESLWVSEGPFSKNTHSPTYFNHFIKRRVVF